MREGGGRKREGERLYLESLISRLMKKLWNILEIVRKYQG